MPKDKAELLATFIRLAQQHFAERGVETRLVRAEDDRPTTTGAAPSRN